MRRAPGRALPARATAVGLALLAHVLLILLFLAARSAPQRSAEQIHFVSVWPQMHQPEPEPEAENPPPVTRLPARVRAAPPVAASGESAAITQPTPAPPQPPVDWHQEAAVVARSRGGKAGDDAQTFSAAPATVRKPCEPPDRSFKWNPETPRAGFTQSLIPLPYVQLGERCVIGLGFFGCNLGAKAEPNSHLFDDLKEGRTQESSVPDPDTCD